MDREEKVKMMDDMFGEEDAGLQEEVRVSRCLVIETAEVPKLEEAPIKEEYGEFQGMPAGEQVASEESTAFINPMTETAEVIEQLEEISIEKECISFQEEFEKEGTEPQQESTAEENAFKDGIEQRERLIERLKKESENKDKIINRLLWLIKQ